MSLPLYWSSLPGNVAQDIALDEIKWTRIETVDGHMLNCYELGRGQREKIVLINALGLPFALLARLGMALSSRFHVIGWDVRGLPETSDPFEDRFASVELQADDLLRINQHFGGDICAAVTWSSGALILLKAMQKGFASCRTRVLLAPSDLTPFANATPFLALFERWFIKAANGNDKDVERLRGKIIAGLSIKEDIPGRALNVAYVSSLEATRRYAKYFTAGLDFREEMRTLFAEASQVQDFLLVHAVDDVFSDHRGSLHAVESGTKVRMALYSKGGHFLMYGQPALVAQDVIACVGRDRTLNAD